MIQECAGGITAPAGFRAAGVHCGIKRVKKDLALLVADGPSACAAVFTKNSVPAAPILVNRLQLERPSRIRAIAVNSGNANACTGERGLQDAWTMASRTAALLGVGTDEVLVSSTGVIGQFLPMDRVEAGLGQAAARLSRDGHLAAAEAIMTTDTFVKELALTVDLPGGSVTFGGMAKGSGMIAPNMATMLAFITTDAAIDPALLRTALVRAVDRSFNRISVDGDTSTNDMAVVLAGGRSGLPLIASATDPAYAAFAAGLEHLLVRLSRMIVLDGEGATKFVEIVVSGAASEADAARAARSIGTSNLVKTAIHGEDANWGRILAAVGNAGIAFAPEETEIRFGDVPILGKNYAIDFSEAEAKRALSAREITIRVTLNGGPGEATFWTCDLSREYVAINASYRS